MTAFARKTLLKGNRIRVLVVDDSVVIRQLVTHALSEDPGVEVVGSAANGAIALSRIAQLNPDVVTLDIEMPEMDGLETLRRIRDEPGRPRVVIFSTLTERGAAVTFEALSLGADDYVTKASNAGSLDRSMAALRAELIPKIRQFFVMSGDAAATPNHTPARRKTIPAPPKPALLCPGVLAIGVSTGGPNALGTILPQLPRDFPIPVLIVQHMPPLFTRFLAERLQACTSLKVVEAEHGAPIEAGSILVARGDYHLRVCRNGVGVVAALDQSPPYNSCRPAVDVLFNSVAELYGASAIAVILTGMGQDGLRGTEALRAAGASIIAQDEASSVVWGMPGAVVAAGLADRVLPLSDIIPEILRCVGRG